MRGSVIDGFWTAFVCGLSAFAVVVGACAGLRFGVLAFLSKRPPVEAATIAAEGGNGMWWVVGAAVGLGAILVPMAVGWWLNRRDVDLARDLFDGMDGRE